MEKRPLDLNAPLLSARRFQSPTNSSELVKRRVVEKPILSSRQQSLPVSKSDWECEEVTKPAAVPFHWEQIPGRPKDEVGSHSHTPDEPSNTPRLPPGRPSNASRHTSGELPKLPPGRVSGPLRYNSGDQNIFRPQVESFSFSDHASLLEKLNESLKCKDESDSESGDDAYSDALDTLSFSESRSFNYSVSGISGYQSSGVKPSGTFCIDAQTRDFMMNRFLPAAKAVVLETPKNVTKKTSLLNEQKPKQVKKAVSGEMKPSVKQYSSDLLSYYSQYIDNVESEDEEQERRIVPVKKSGKAWGILPRGMLPRFCVKNSLCLLNPLPSMKSKSRPPSPAPREVRRLSRNAHSGPLDKIPSQVIQKKRFHSGLLSRDLQQVDHRSTNESNHFFNSRVSPLRRYRSGSVSPYRNESPRSPFREGAGFLGVPKEVENFNANKIASSRKMFKALQDVSRNQISERGSDPTVDPVEKTVYIDYVKKKDSSRLKPPCSNVEEVVDISGERSKVFKDNHTVKFDPDKSSMKEGRSTHKLPCSAHVSNVADATEDVIQNQTRYQESKTLECPQDGLDKQEIDVPCKSPLAPPLPKSPSESWLWRTLPSISLGNPFANSRRSSPIHPKKQGQKTNTKWETIVKTSNLRNDHHVRYSEELVPRASLRQGKS